MLKHQLGERKKNINNYHTFRSPVLPEKSAFKFEFSNEKSSLSCLFIENDPLKIENWNLNHHNKNINNSNIVNQFDHQNPETCQINPSFSINLWWFYSVNLERLQVLSNWWLTLITTHILAERKSRAHQH